MTTIITPEGATLPFDRTRLERSLRRRGLDAEVAHAVAERLEEIVQESPGSIPISQMNPLIGEALLDLAREDAPRALRPPRAPREEPERRDPREEREIPELPGRVAEAPARPVRLRVPTNGAAAADPHREVRMDPWFAFRRALGLPAMDGQGHDGPSGLAFPGPRVAKSVYSNDTSTARSICMTLAYSGHVSLELPGGRAVELEGVARECRDVEVPPGGSIHVRGVMEPYSVVSWVIH